jgi:GNAT superfamily N-acetyltransferase
MHPAPPVTIKFRDDVRPGDSAAVRHIVESTGFFHDHEVEVAVELVDERLAHGLASEYFFVFADDGADTIGYTCYGPIACTVGSYDLYWIAVEGSRRGGGLGRQLLEAAERAIAATGGRRIYIETSSQPLYEPTRQFYLRCGYRVDAILADYYAPGDGKVIFVKAVSANGHTA